MVTVEIKIVDKDALDIEYDYSIKGDKACTSELEIGKLILKNVQDTEKILTKGLLELKDKERPIRDGNVLKYKRRF